MSRISVQVSILQQSQAPDAIRPEYSASDIMDKVQQYLYDINSGYIDSAWQWKYLKHMYNVLSKKPKLNEDEKELLGMIEPEIMKNAEYDSEDAAELDGTTMFRHLEDDDE